MDLVRAKGQWVFTDVDVSNSAATNLRLVQVDEAVDLKVFGGSLDSPGPQPYENVLLGNTGGPSSITALFRGTSFSNAPRGIDAATSGLASINLTVDGGSAFSEHSDRAMQLRTNGAGSSFTIVVDQL